MFLGDQFRPAQIVQGSLDGGAGKPQFGGDSPYSRPALVCVFMVSPHFRRRELHIARDGIFIKIPSLAHSVAPPLQIEPASLGFDLVVPVSAAVSKRPPHT